METMGKPDKSLDETVKHICDVVQERIDEAYQKGREDGRNETWWAARKIVLSPDEGGTSLLTLFAIFGCGSMQQAFRKNSASEAIEKLKAYEEQKADEEVEVGDEVTDIQSGANFLVTHLWESNHGDKGVSGFNNDCSAFSARHFDIEEILEEMKR